MNWNKLCAPRTHTRYMMLTAWNLTDMLSVAFCSLPQFFTSTRPWDTSLRGRCERREIRGIWVEEALRT